MTGPIDRAYVEILPLTTGFATGVKTEVDAAVRSTQGSVAALGASAGKVTTTVETAATGMFTRVRESIAGVARIALPLAGVLAVGEFFKGVIESSISLQKIERQTATVIQSTGGAAHVSAQQISDYGVALAKQTGISHDVIQSGENLLLIYTNVRNEVGKGNDIFTQATRVALDMSVAMGRDLTSSVRVVGRALNDPIKGTSLLTRAGVQLTDSQKKQLAALAATGHVLEAQKIILHDLDVKFAGSAQAQATSGGKLSVAWELFQQSIGKHVLPVLDELKTKLAEGVTWLTNAFEEAGRGKGAFASVAAVIKSLVGVIKEAAPVVRDVFTTAWHVLSDTLHVVGTVLSSIASALNSVKGPLVAVGIAVGVVWLAFKAFEGAKVVVLAVDAALGRLAARAPRVGQSIGGALANITPMQGAVGALGIGLGILAIGWQQNAASAAAAAAETKRVWSDLANSIQQDNGVIGSNTQQVILNTLAQAGAVQIGSKYGLTLDQLSQAVQGNTKYMKEATLAVLGGNLWKNGTADTVKYLNALSNLSTGLKAQIAQYKAIATAENAHQAAVDGGTSAVNAQASALGISKGAYLQAQVAQQKNTSTTRQQTIAFQLENDAVSLLNQALNGLAGVHLAVAQAVTSLHSANLSALDAFKKNGTAIHGETAAAVANQQALQGQVAAAQAVAQAVGKQTHSTVQEAISMIDSRNAIEAQLRARHKLTPAVQAYIDQLYNVTKLSDYLLAHPTKLDADPTRAHVKIQVLRQEIDDIKQGRVPGLDANSDAGKAKIAQLQALINHIRQTNPPVIRVSDNATSVINSIKANLAGLSATGVSIAVSAYQRGTRTGHAATGGLIVGQGTGTSDTAGLFALSNREYVSTAASTSKNLPALEAGNHGAKLTVIRGMATGGTPIAPRAFSTFSTTTQHDIVKYLNAIHQALRGTVSDLRSAFNQLIPVLRSAHVSTAGIDKLRANEIDLIMLMKQRDHLAASIVKHQQTLNALVQQYHQLVSSTRATIVGAFDITSFGTTSGGTSSQGLPLAPTSASAGSIVSSLQAMLARVRKFSALLHKLVKEGVPLPLVQQLAAAGVSSYDVAQALSLATPKQIAQLRTGYAGLQQTGTALGQFLGGQQFGGQIRAQREELRRERNQEERIKRLIEHHEERMARAFAHALAGVAIEFDGDGLARLVTRRQALQAGKGRHH